MSLHPVIPHLKTVVSIFSEHKKKSILSEPFRNDLESQVFPCLWCNGSNNLHSRHILAMPPDAMVKGSLSSIVRTILWFSFCFLFIIIVMSVTAACRGRSFIFVCCIVNHCYLIIDVSSNVFIYPLQGLYMVKIVVRELFFPKIVKNVQRPIPEGSCPFCRTADEILSKVNIVVSPGLQSQFYVISDSEVQTLILCFGRVSLRVCLNL